MKKIDFIFRLIQIQHKSQTTISIMNSQQVIDNGIASCDERIASLQEKIDSWKGYKGVIGRSILL